MRFIYILLASLSMVACGNNSKSANNNVKSEQNSMATIVPAFSADSAFQYIQSQVDFGTRVPNSAAHVECAKYLENKLKDFGANVIVQNADLRAFDGKVLKAKNIIASFNVENKNRILLFAHWDTRPWADQDADKNKLNTPILGANDGASGVGVLLEMARSIGTIAPKIGVDIIFFDAEDYGAPEHLDSNAGSESWCLGSQYWAKNPHKSGYNARYGILLDMVGAKNATFYKEGYSMQYAPNVVEKVWNQAAALGFGKYFVNEGSSWITDDHYFVNSIAGIPSIDIIQYDPNSQHGFGSYWHTTNDNMSNIDKNTLMAVGTTLMHILYNEK